MNSRRLKRNFGVERLLIQLIEQLIKKDLQIKIIVLLFEMILIWKRILCKLRLKLQLLEDKIQ